VNAFDILGDPCRRRILELLTDHEQSSGELVEVIQGEFGISQPAVSQHLRVLRESGFASVRPAGTRRIYALQAERLQEVDTWLDHFRAFWEPRFDALALEVARGKRERRRRE
jgi:DNA-binding transcriptional ArsR family regulator